jgi:hypothetical protein
MALPAVLIAAAAGLGIKKAATYTYKQLKKRIAKAQKDKKTKQTKAEKGYKGKGAKRKEEKVTQRKKDEKWNLGVRGKTQISPTSLSISQSLK